jgi:hypothetical protein
VKELKSIEFTERLAPIFEYISRESGVSFDGSYFFPHWRHLMELGVARAWTDEGCVLGAIFTPDLFSGDMRGLVYFWLALPHIRGTDKPIKLFRSFQIASELSGCKKLSSAAHANLNHAKMCRNYENAGFKLTESVYTQDL